MSVIYIDQSRYMDDKEAIHVMRALGEPTRLGVMRLLTLSSQPLPAGDIAKSLKVRQNTLSAHISALSRCDLILGHRQGRHILYACNPRKAQLLRDYLAQNLCRT